MAFGKLGQTFSALEIYQIVKDDLKSVEEEIRLESIASIDTISAITKHLHAGGGKRLRPTLLLLPLSLLLALPAGARITPALRTTAARR